VSHNVRAKMSIVCIATMYKGVQGVVHLVHNDLAVKTFVQGAKGTSLHLVSGVLSLS